ncbi:RPT6A [Symbiodinium sp. CCMP2592]|nr:RPT6A [Symbiodinium sp. CCMP2592]
MGRGNGGRGRGGGSGGRDGYRSWSPVTAPPTWQGGYQGYHQWWRKPHEERQEEEDDGVHLRTIGEATIQRNWLRCMACQKSFKTQYSYQQHYQAKHASQAPQAQDVPEPEVVPDSSVLPEESISQGKVRVAKGGQGYVAPGPDTVAALGFSAAQLQGPSPMPPPAGPPDSQASGSAASSGRGGRRNELLANFLQSMGSLVREMGDDVPLPKQGPSPPSGR